MNDKFGWVINSAGEYTVVALTGAIDQDANLSALAEPLKETTKLRFDMQGITRINSVGVRDWVGFMGSLPADASIEIERIPPQIVNHLNLVKNFVGRARVVSVAVPFACEDCDHEKVTVYDVREGRAPSLTDQSCPKCNGSLRIDDFAESYFAFLK